jgi:hypothetical protein
MIHYQLCCDAEHEFDGWFKDSDNFDRQAARKLISCPVCASTKIRRALMAPGIRKKGGVSPVGVARGGVSPVIEADTHLPAPAPPAPHVSNQRAGGIMPDQVRAALLKLRAEVEKNCDYVGPNFAEEARRIHNGESQPRGIYGESTEAEAEALADEGIGVAQIPWLPRADS